MDNANGCMENRLCERFDRDMCYSILNDTLQLGISRLYVQFVRFALRQRISHSRSLHANEVAASYTSSDTMQI